MVEFGKEDKKRRQGKKEGRMFETEAVIKKDMGLVYNYIYGNSCNWNR